MPAPKSERLGDDDLRDDLDREDDPDQPPASTFWKNYNSRLEFPISTLVSIFCHGLIVVALVLLWVYSMRNQAEAVPIRLVEGGWDDKGDGSAGSGGVADPLAVGEAPSQKDKEALPQLTKLPEVQEQLKKQFELEDPTAVGSISEDKAREYNVLDEKLRNAMLGIGQKRGSGGGPGSGNTGQDGVGPGGTGFDSTRARSLRWVLRFRTSDGRDYLNQLMAMGAIVTVPVPPNNAQFYIFRDLKNPKPGTVASDADLAVLSKMIQFSDFRRDSVVGVGQALGLPFTPAQFWAYFPAKLEQELARLEVSYRNRRAEDIEETIFSVSVRNGEPALVVVEQRAKR